MPNLRWLRIPPEMRERRQWAVATLTPLPNGKQDKAPVNPLTGERIKVTDPSSWVSFEEAANSGYPAIGYILASDDPFTIIDLDKTDQAANLERQLKIYESFDTYAERSQSGQGVHIIARGKIGGGSRRDAVEVYDQERFMICTGDVIRDAPIRDFDELLNILVTEMGGTRTEADLPVSAAEVESDDALLQRMLSARNSDKFKDLYYRKPTEAEDWSQRDASLAQMIAFHTRNHEQALRLFRGSALYRPNTKGKNPEHYERYYLLERTFARAWRAEDMKRADIELGKQLAEQLLRKSPEQVDTEKQADALVFPGGLVGDIARFILGAANRQVPEVALAGALTFCSGVFGRQYNVSNTGLNLYTIMVAPTGRGKEAASAGIDMLMAALRPKMPIVDEYRGPGHIASGQGLIRRLDEYPSCFSFLSEFGAVLRIITDSRANAADVRTKQVLLDLFSKSGQRQFLHSSAYADKEKNTKTVQAPCFAFMGDTTPEGYFEAINQDVIAEGMIPRFLMIYYDGPRKPRNKTPVVTPHPDLVDRLVTAFTSLANMMHANTFVDVQFDAEATRLLDAFDEECDDRINEGTLLAEMWNRAHLKVLRVAALVAVGKNPFEPVIRLEDAQWALDLIRREISQMSVQFNTGGIGSGAAQQDSEMIKVIRDWLESPIHARLNYRTPPEVANRNDIIPFQYIRRRLRVVKAFADDRKGASAAINQAVQDAIDMDVIQQLSREQIQEMFGTAVRPTARLYILGRGFA